MFTETVEKAKKAGIIYNDGDVFRVELNQIKTLEGMNREAVQAFLVGKEESLLEKISCGNYSIEYSEDHGDETLPFTLKKSVLVVDGVPIAEHVIYEGLRMLNITTDIDLIDKAALDNLKAATAEPSLANKIVDTGGIPAVSIGQWIDDMYEDLY